VLISKEGTDERGFGPAKSRGGRAGPAVMDHRGHLRQQPIVRAGTDHVAVGAGGDVDLGPRRLDDDATVGLVGRRHDEGSEMGRIVNDHAAKTDEDGGGLGTGGTGLVLIEPRYKVGEGGDVKVLVDGLFDDLLVGEGSDDADLLGPTELGLGE